MIEMTKRDYVAIADLLAGELSIAATPAERRTVRNIAGGLADRFARENARFDRATFYAAVGLEVVRPVRHGATARIVMSPSGAGADIALIRRGATAGEFVGNVAWCAGPEGEGYRVMLFSRGYPRLFGRDGLIAAMRYAAEQFSSPVTA